MISLPLLFRLTLTSLTAVCFLALSYQTTSASNTQNAVNALTPEEQKLLTGLVKEFLFDPTGTERIRVKTTVRSTWGRLSSVTRDGWLQKWDHKTPNRVFFVDSESVVVPAGEKLERIDFVADCKTRFAVKKPEKKNPDELRRERFQRLRRNAVTQVDGSDLVRAAWLHRLGHGELAAVALQRAREKSGGDDKKMIAELRGDLAWSAFAGLVHAFMVRADEDALASGERLLRLYPEEAKEYPQAASIVADLKRRKREGSFGQRTAAVYPEGFADWDVDKRIAFLIKALDEVDARQMSQPGSVTLSMDRRVVALIRMGDVAVPALIDTIENDRRLTRSVHFWRDFSRYRTVLGVREAALEAVMTILRVQFFAANSTGDNLTSRGDQPAKQMAIRLRAYWKKFGGFPFDERMMKVIADPKSSFQATREAAYNLAHLGESRMLSTSGAMITSSPRDNARRKSPGPAVAKFINPTAAEAILTAMDRDLKNHDAKLRDDLYDFRRRKIEDQYLEPLIYLGDNRIAGKLKQRYQTAKTIRGRRRWANAAHQLGNPEAMKEFASDVEEGKLKLPANDRPNSNATDQPGNVELRGIIQDLARTAAPEANRALFAIADPNHPYFEIVSNRVLNSSPNWSDSEPWFSHAYCLKILRRELDNQKTTGGTYRIEGMRLIHEQNNGGSSTSPIPPFLADPKTRRAKVDARHCDRAVEKLRGLVIGLPAYHPLHKDADEKLKALIRAFDSYRNGYRRVTPLEGKFLGVYADDPVYIPDIQPLGRPATEEDVKTGRAIFHLGSKGVLAKLRLPAVASLKTDDAASMDSFARPKLLIIVQGEVDENGNTVYGVIGDGAGRMAKPEELTSIKPIKKSFSLFEIFK